MLRGFLFDLGGTLYHFHGASEKQLYEMGARRSYEFLRERHGLGVDFDTYARRVRRFFLPTRRWALASGRELEPRRLYPRIAARL